jgi:hypothetical protein
MQADLKEIQRNLGETEVNLENLHKVRGRYSELRRRYR